VKREAIGLGTSAIAKGTALGYQAAKVVDSTTQKPARGAKQINPPKSDIAVKSTSETELKN
jgi:hypothetical protein